MRAVCCFLWMWWMSGCGDSVERTLLATAPEPPGANCAEGGSAIASGIDDNGNGVLDPGEVTSTTYVCTGQANSLISVVPEPAGANCPAGGQAIKVGIDLNNNSVLDADEVQSTSYLCNPSPPTTIEGSIIVRNSLDANELLGVETITGDLTLDATGLTSLDLSSLRSVGGALNIVNYSGTTLAFSGLVSVGQLSMTGANLSALTTFSAPSLLSASQLFLRDVPVATVSLPALASINLSAYISGPAVTSLSFPHAASAFALTLDRIGVQSLDVGTAFPALAAFKWIDVSNSAALTSFALGAAQAPQGVTLDNNAVLTTVDLRNLTTVDSLWLQSDPALTSINVAALTTITSNAFIRGDDALLGVAFPSLTTACTVTTNVQFQIASNPLLQSITAPSWTTFGTATFHPYLGIYDNPQLPTCMAQALASQVGATNVSIYGNGSGTCP